MAGGWIPDRINSFLRARREFGSIAGAKEVREFTGLWIEAERDATGRVYPRDGVLRPCVDVPAA